MAGQKQKRRLKKGFNHAGGCRHTICRNATGLYGSLSASFELPSSFTRKEMARNNAAVASGSAGGNPEAYRCMLSDILEGSEMPRNVGRRFLTAYSPGADPQGDP
ncbi:hypothetical protein MF621_004198 (plasmid) [Bacillus velezensis]|uniref:Uncharacterized protein n=1 Tax=Bacillus velezensis TaxID=492670 RepID=A0ABC8DFJ8_BACVE|nr:MULTISPECIES: hypothetical protein [Bacillus amyloliquefaciens group]AVI31046.1 hypothetical protein C3Z10_21865 [Bacillus velezensis]AWX74680.1 hypothetical protein BVDSYZ_21795 [Bacillus velezensis]MDK2561817.1 hypothetical protein [Bacillus amyloliquefaciens]URJ76500.1 hypothetical protein MF619_004217 [Bacillus velezensis]URJ80507.1 hypothetical protein MF621_004198 [Bacillus velezensis]